jgi:hypothetical protein
MTDCGRRPGFNSENKESRWATDVGHGFDEARGSFNKRARFRVGKQLKIPSVFQQLQFCYTNNNRIESVLNLGVSS